LLKLRKQEVLAIKRLYLFYALYISFLPMDGQSSVCSRYCMQRVGKRALACFEAGALCLLVARFPIGCLCAWTRSCLNIGFSMIILKGLAFTENSEK
jgi:hypothetical protein